MSPSERLLILFDQTTEEQPLCASIVPTSYLVLSTDPGPRITKYICTHTSSTSMYANVHGHLHSKVHQRVLKLTITLRYYSRRRSVRSRACSLITQPQQQQDEPLRVTLGRSIDEAGRQSGGRL